MMMIIYMVALVRALSPCLNRKSSVAYELYTIHALATDMIGEPSEEKLTKECPDGGGDFETKVLVGSVAATLVVHVADHSCRD